MNKSFRQQLSFLFLIFLLNPTFIWGQEATIPDTTLANQIIEEIRNTEYAKDYEAQLQKLDQAIGIFEKAELWEDWVEGLTKKIEIYDQHNLNEAESKVTDFAFKESTNRLGESHPKTIWLYTYLASQLDETGETELAWAKFQKGFELSKKVNGKLHEDTGNFYRLSVDYLSKLGKSKKALENAKMALEIEEKMYGKFSTELALPLLTLSRQNYRNNLLEEAKINLERAITIVEDKKGGTAAILGDLNKALGFVLDGLWDWKAGLKKYEKALKIYKNVYGNNDPKIGEILLDQGLLCYRWSQFEQAELILLEALNIFKLKPKGNKENIGDAYVKLGALYHVWKKNEQSLPYLDSALLIVNHPFSLIDIYDLKARANLELGNYEAALVATNKNLEFITVDFQAKAPNENPKKEEITDKVESLWKLYLKSRIYFEYWESQKERNELLDNANQILQLAVEIMEEQQQNLHLQQGYVNQIMYIGLRIYWQLVEVNLALLEITKKQEYMDKAFASAEKRKSLKLRSYKKGEITKRVNIPKEILEEGNVITEKILEHETQFNIANKENDKDKILKLRDGRLTKLRAAQRAYFKKLEQNYPEYYNEVYNFSAVSTASIQQHLGEEEIFVEYVIHTKDTVIYAFLLEKNKQPDFIKINIRGERDKDKTNLDVKISDLYKLLQGGNLKRGDRKKRFIDSSNELYEIFIEPIKERLADKKKIIFANDALSNYIPFETLLPSDEIKPFSELDFLVNDYEISYQYTGRLFVDSKETNRTYDKKLLAFAPVFSNNDVAQIQDEDFRTVVDTTFRSMGDGHFEPLYHTEREVENINNLFLEKGLKDCTLLTHELAQESTLKSVLKENYQIVHIASHSFANMQNAKFSGIACAQKADNKSNGDSPVNKEDGILYIGEIQNLAVNSDLVVLSSCESGHGKMLLGDGVLGLNRSFIYAGARNVVFSLWKVYDQPTSQLMSYFYEGVVEGKPYAAALQQAKLKMLSQNELASPEFWGAFMLIGE